MSTPSQADYSTPHFLATTGLLSRLIRGLTIASLLLGLSGCSWFSDLFEGDENKHAKELVKIENRLKVNTVWQLSLGGKKEGQHSQLRPAADQSAVYAASSSGRLLAVDAQTGQSKWQIETGKELTGGVGLGDGLVYVGSRKGELMAYDKTTGEQRWITILSSTILTPAVSADEKTVVKTIDGRLHGLNTADGSKAWSYERRVPLLTLYGNSQVLISEGFVVAGFDSGKLTLLELQTGKPVWERTVAAATGRSELERMVDIDADPLVASGDIYVAAFQARLMAVDQESGRVRWVHKISTYAGFDLSGDSVMVSDEDGLLWNLDRSTGKPLWKQDILEGRQPGTPRVVGSFASVGDREGYVHWFSLQTGEIAARVKLTSAPIMVRPLYANELLYVLATDGTLTALSVL